MESHILRGGFDINVHGLGKGTRLQSDLYNRNKLKLYTRVTEGIVN